MTEIMQSRQAGGLAVPDAPQSSAMAAMDAEFRMAQAIARAGDMLPRNYRDKPGAVILVNQWAKAHQVDMLTAMQTVAFVQGRPVIDATMQRALAEKAGYTLRIPTVDRTAATVEVWRDGELVGSATYTWDDATTAKLTGKDNWKNNPEDMLVARATTRAIRRFAPSVMLGMADRDEADQLDPANVLAPAPTREVVAGVAAPDDPGADPSPAPVARAASLAPDVVDAEIVDQIAGEVADDAGSGDGPPDNPSSGSAEADSPALPKMTLTELETAVKVAGVSKAETIRQAQEIAKVDGLDLPGSLGAILASPVLPKVVDWLQSAEEEPF